MSSRSRGPSCPGLGAGLAIPPGGGGDEEALHQRNGNDVFDDARDGFGEKRRELPQRALRNGEYHVPGKNLSVCVLAGLQAEAEELPALSDREQAVAGVDRDGAGGGGDFARQFRDESLRPLLYPHELSFRV